MTMGFSIWSLYLLAVLPSAHLSYALEWNETHIPKCSKLVTRKEWRVLTSGEKAEWVESVKVRACSLP